MNELLKDKTPMQARHIRPGQGQAVELKTGQLLQIQTVKGKQVADFVAFTLGDTGEYLSTSATRATNATIVPQLGMTLYSNRRQPLFEIVEDTVGRHDMLFACCDPVRYEMLGAEPGHASCRAALTDALTDYEIGFDRIPSPINWFMNVGIQQRGELEIREPLADAGDYVVLRALKDVIAAVSACPQDMGPTNAFNPTELMIRVYRDAPLPDSPTMTNGTAPPARTGTASPATPPGRLHDTPEATVVRVE
ncbi:MAG: urea carboxylase-associated family protein [Chloroflexota bacterium]|nr:urea carboxylase-associated family protein [Chloroflexota bacterium]